MIVFRQPDEITDWRLVFFPVGTYRWARFVPGRFKHVAAFGYSDACRTWVIYDVTLAGTRVHVLPEGPAGLDVLARWLEGNAVLRPTKADKGRQFNSRPLLAFYCVPAVRHLIRARCGAITPTGLYRALVAQGAEIINHGVEREPAGAQHPVAAHRAERGGGGSRHCEAGALGPG